MVTVSGSIQMAACSLLTGRTTVSRYSPRMARSLPSGLTSPDHATYLSMLMRSCMSLN